MVRTHALLACLLALAVSAEDRAPAPPAAPVIESVETVAKKVLAQLDARIADAGKRWRAESDAAGNPALGETERERHRQSAARLETLLKGFLEQRAKVVSQLRLLEEARKAAPVQPPPSPGPGDPKKE